MAADRQQAHHLLDQLDTGQFAAVTRLLEVMVCSDRVQEPLTEEERLAGASSRDWFDRNPEGIDLETIVAECGLTMDDIRKRASE